MVTEESVLMQGCWSGRASIWACRPRQAGRCRGSPTPMAARPLGCPPACAHPLPWALPLGLAPQVPPTTTPPVLAPVLLTLESPAGALMRSCR